MIVESKILNTEDIENISCIADFIEDERHIKKINPFIEGNKVEYFINIQNYIEVYYINKNNYTFNAIIQDHQFIRKNLNSLEVEGLIKSTLSIMKNYEKYKIIDHDFIKYEIDVFQCIDILISDIKDIINVENINDITLESNLITMYKDGKVLAEFNIKNEIPFLRFKKEEQNIILKYCYDKLEENNINYKLIV